MLPKGVSPAYITILIRKRVLAVPQFCTCNKHVFHLQSQMLFHCPHPFWLLHPWQSKLSANLVLRLAGQSDNVKLSFYRFVVLQPWWKSKVERLTTCGQKVKKKASGTNKSDRLGLSHLCVCVCEPPFVCVNICSTCVAQLTRRKTSRGCFTHWIINWLTHRMM